MTDDDEQVNQASALWARPKSEITDEQYEEFYKHVGARLRAAARVGAREGRGPSGVHAALLPPAPGAVRSVGSRPAARREALRPARLHHGRGRTAAAGVSALRPRHRRFERSAAERLARDPAAVARRRADSGRVRSSACSDCSRIWPTNQQREIRDVLDDVRPRAEGGRSSRTQAIASGSRSCCALRRRTPTAPAQTVSLADYVVAHEDRAGRHLLRHRRQLLGRDATVRTSRCSASTASRCCC